MTDDLPNNPALLPSGLRDLLPPEAEVEAMAVASLTEVFASHGYERVKPPLIEFEDSLFTGSGAAVAEQTFRLMDPDSQRMMGVRADITPQIARIATTRLANAPRPLRLSYFGECLRVRGGQLAPDRQIAQAGIELIGSPSSAADAEIVLLGAEALAALGVHHASFDLTLPTLAPALIEHAGIEGLARNGLARALDRKDAVSVARHGGRLAGVLTDLLHAAGPADRALAALQSASLPQAVRILADQAAETIAAIRIRAPGLRLTLDPVEFRGFRYHTGVAVTIYAPGRYKELGRGGRYLCGEAEAATGLTLYPDVILQAAPAPKARPRVFVPAGTEQAAAASLRGEGYATVASLDGEADPESEAARLRCDYIIR
ncbi:MAG: ATP phosphoribosyltransferase regulatory subunit, partial [Acetobacteraceae bacterium]|nr:ATP phosphoribosyltransferase regulatory subunit [Acetobacteraceae bacterium]